MFTLIALASNVSGITMLGVPAEMYTYGSQYSALNLSAVLVCVAVVRWFVPVFFKLQFTSSYEVRLELVRGTRPHLP